MSHLKFASVVFASLGFAAFVWASGADELREKAQTMRREAAELAEKGHKEDADTLERRAAALLEEAEQFGRRHPKPREAEVRELHHILEKLRQEEAHLREEDAAEERIADVRQEAEQVELELQKITRGSHREHDSPHHETAERLENMHIAIEHLHHAGLHEIAEHVAERAEATERELHEHGPHREDELMHTVMQQLDELRHELRRLRDEVNELREDR